MKWYFRYILHCFLPNIRIAVIFILLFSGCHQGNQKGIRPFTKFKQTTLERLTDAYLNYLEEISSPDFPINNFQSDPKLANSKFYLNRIQKDSDFKYFPTLLWQIYSLNDQPKWKQYATNFGNVVAEYQSQEPFRNLETIQNNLLTTYQITGNTRYQSVLIQSMKNHLSGIGYEEIRESTSGPEKEIPIQNLLENQLLFFTSEKTGDQVYKNIALKNTDLIIDQYFSDKKEFKSNTNYSYLAIGLYGFTYLYQKTGIENYKMLAQKIALLFMPFFNSPDTAVKKDLIQQTDPKLDLSTEAMVCLGLYNLDDQNGNQYRETSETIYNHILGSIENIEESKIDTRSFKLFYYLFEFERLKQFGDSDVKS